MVQKTLDWQTHSAAPNHRNDLNPERSDPIFSRKHSSLWWGTNNTLSWVYRGSQLCIRFPDSHAAAQSLSWRCYTRKLSQLACFVNNNNNNSSVCVTHVCANKQVLPHSDDFWNLHPKRTFVILLPPSRVETIWRRFSWLLRQVCILPCPCLHLHLFFKTVQKTSSRQGKDTWAQWFQYTTLQICCWQGRDITLKTTTTKTKKHHCCMALNQSIKPVTNNRLPKRPPTTPPPHLMKQIKFLILNYKINYISMSYSTDINLQHE